MAQTASGAVASLLLAGAALLTLALLRKEILHSKPGRAAVAAFASVPTALTAALSRARRRPRTPAQEKSDQDMAAEWSWAALP